MPHCEHDPLVLAVCGASVLVARSCKASSGQMKWHLCCRRASWSNLLYLFNWPCATLSCSSAGDLVILDL